MKQKFYNKLLTQIEFNELREVVELSMESVQPCIFYEIKVYLFIKSGLMLLGGIYLLD